MKLNAVLKAVRTIGVGGLAAAALLAMPATAMAVPVSTVSFSTTSLISMDHYFAYSWRIDNIAATNAGYGIIGAIAGRAIYEGTLNFKDAMKAAGGA